MAAGYPPRPKTTDIQTGDAHPAWQSNPAFVGVFPMHSDRNPQGFVLRTPPWVMRNSGVWSPCQPHGCDTTCI